MVEERVEVKEGDILIIHTGYHHYGWDQPTADEIRYMVKHPGPGPRVRRVGQEEEAALDRRRLRQRRPPDEHHHPRVDAARRPRSATRTSRQKYGKPLERVLRRPDKYQLMHIEMFNHGIIHAECLGGDIDLLLNQRATIGCFPWRFVDGESCISRIVALVEDERYDELMAKKKKAKLTKFGDVAGAKNAWLHEEAQEGTEVETGQTLTRPGIASGRRISWLLTNLRTKLRPPEVPLAPYPSKVITLASGELMVVRECQARGRRRPARHRVSRCSAWPKDFYDIVAARMYSEILGWFRYRVANEFVLVGAIDGVIAGIVTSRHVDPGSA